MGENLFADADKKGVDMWGLQRFSGYAKLWERVRKGEPNG